MRLFTPLAAAALALTMGAGAALAEECTPEVAEGKVGTIATRAEKLAETDPERAMGVAMELGTLDQQFPFLTADRDPTAEEATAFCAKLDEMITKLN